MKRFTIIFAGLLLAVCWLGNSALSAQATKAGTKQPNLSTDKGKEGGAAAVSLFNQASELVRYARENESPVAMLAAVQIIQRVRFQQGPSARLGAKKSEGEQGKEGQKGKTPEVTLDQQKLLAEAKGWAKGNEHVLALIAAQSAKPASGGTLGSTSGPIVHYDSVLAGRTDSYTLTFQGGEMARIAVVGDGDTDLDLYVFDEYGNEIGRDDDYTDHCLVQWAPRWTGRFTVKIANRGSVYNRYALLTN